MKCEVIKKQNNSPSSSSSSSSPSSSYDMISCLVNDILEDVITRCDLAHFMDNSLKTMRRSGGTKAFFSNTLWRHLSNLSGKIFNDQKEPISVRLFIVFSMICASGMEILPKSFIHNSNNNKSSSSSNLNSNSNSTMSDHMKREEMLSAKELCLIIVCDFISKVKEGMRNSLRWGFLVRRLVISLILTNFPIAIEEPRLLEPLLKLLTLCWRHFRTHLKTELSIIIDDILLRILKAKTNIEVSSEVQLLVLKELSGWLLGSEMPEVYLNFDVEKSHSLVGKSLYKELCSTLCSLTEDRQTLNNNNNGDSVGGVLVENETSLSALHALSEVMKSLLDMSGHVQYMASNRRARKMSMTAGGLGGWETEDVEDDVEVEASTDSINVLSKNKNNTSEASSEDTINIDMANIPDMTPVTDDRNSSTSTTTTTSSRRDSEEDEPIRHTIRHTTFIPDVGVVTVSPDMHHDHHKNGDGVGVTFAPSSSSSSSDASTESMIKTSRPATLKKVTSFRARQDVGQRSKELLAQGLELYHKKQSINKCIAYLVAQSYITDSPREIASFLRMNIKCFSEEDIGDYLGGGEGEYYDSIRFSYCSVISFVGLTVEQALRHFLTSAHFRLPGEAQKIDRLINTFANCWWADNINTQNHNQSQNQSQNQNNNKKKSDKWEPNHVDSIYLLAFAVIMLNTDLHRAQNKKHKKMKKSDFIYNLSRGDDSLPKELLEEIYDSVQAEQIKMPIVGQPDTAATVSSSSDKNNKNKDENGNGNRNEKVLFDKALKQSLLRSEELFQGLSLYHHHYFMLGVDMHVSLEVVLSMFDNIWWMVHSLLSSLYENEFKQTLSIELLSESLSVLQYAIGASIFLGLDKERTAFMLLLSQFKHRFDNPNNHHQTSSPTKAKQNNLGSTSEFDTYNNASSPTGTGSGSGGQMTSRLLSAPQEKWFIALKNAKASEGMDMMATHLIPIIMNLRIKLETDFDSSILAKEMKDVVSTLEHADHLIDGRRYFIKEGDLVKVSRNGAKKTYRFILFSDQLIYGAKTTFGSGYYRIHNYLLLSHIKVDFDIFDDKNFHLTHPLKSFMLLAENKEEREEWVKAISDAASTCRPNELSIREEN